MTTHAQVVIAAPDGHLPLFLQGAGEVIRHGELVGQAVDGFEDAVGVVALLLDDLLLEELVVAEARHCGRGRGLASRKLLLEPGRRALEQRLATARRFERAPATLTVGREVVLQQVGDPFGPLREEAIYQAVSLVCASTVGGCQGGLLQLGRGHLCEMDEGSKKKEKKHMLRRSHACWILNS